MEQKKEQQTVATPHQVHHIIPFKILAKVFIGLLCLTALTVICARIDLGVMAAPVAFLIAFVKAMLVMAFFMGLKYDEKSNRFIFSLGFIFLAVFFAFCVIDIFTRVNLHSTL